MAAAPAPSNAGRRRPVLLGIGVLGLLLLVGAAAVLWTASRPGDPRDVVDEWVAAVNAEDVDRMFDLMCQQRRDAIPKDYVASRLAEDGNGPTLTDVRVAEPREEGDGVAVDVRFVFQGGSRETTLRLVDEDGWRLCDGAWVNF